MLILDVAKLPLGPVWSSYRLLSQYCHTGSSSSTHPLPNGNERILVLDIATDGQRCNGHDNNISEANTTTSTVDSHLVSDWVLTYDEDLGCSKAAPWLNMVIVY